MGGKHAINKEEKIVFDVGDFRSKIEEMGVLRPTLFRVTVGPPKILLNQTIISSKTIDKDYSFRQRPASPQFMYNLAFRAESFREPGVNLMTYDVNRYGIGLFEKRAYNAQYTDTTITFLSDRKNQIWNFWNSWINAVFNHSPGLMDDKEYPKMTVSYKDDYVSGIWVQKFDETGDTVAFFRLNRAFPTFINDQELNWGAHNQLCRVTIGINFHTWDAGTKMSPGVPTVPITDTHALTPQSPNPPQFGSPPPKG